MCTGKGFTLPSVQNVRAAGGVLRKKYCTDFYQLPPSNTENIFPYGQKDVLLSIHGSLVFVDTSLVVYGSASVERNCAIAVIPIFSL